MKYLYGLILLVLVAVCGAIFLFHDILSYKLREIFAIPLYINGSHLSPVEIELKDIVIKNPPGYPAENILEIKRLALDAPLNRYFSPSIELSKLTVSDVVLKWQFLTVNASSSNIDDIIKVVYEKWKESFTGLNKISLLVREAVFENLSLEIAFLDQPDKVYRLPAIPKVEVSSIHTEGKDVLELIGASILIELVKQIVLQHLSSQNLQYGTSLPGSTTLDQANRFTSIELIN